MGLSVVLHSWCFGLSSVDSHAGEVRMSYDPRFVTARDFMAASLPLNSSGPGLVPRHRNTTTYTGKSSAWFSCLCQLGVSQMFSSLEARIIQGPFPKALSVPGSRFGQKFILIMDVGKTGSRESLGIIYWYRCSPWVHLLKEGFGNG